MRLRTGLDYILGMEANLSVACRTYPDVKDCLVYSIGAWGVFDFEEDILRRAPDCEIHSFDPTGTVENEDRAKGRGINYHAWGLSSRQHPGEVLGRGFLMTLAEIIINSDILGGTFTF